MSGPELRTERLILRRWGPDDLAPFAAMNADPVVMEHFPAPVTKEQTADLVERIERQFEEHGYGLWAVEVRGADRFIGFVGLSRVPFEAHFTPAVEVGWRLAAAHWGRGYATEAARVAVAFGFERAGLAEVVSMTTPGNRRSWRVMERIGMHRDPRDDFDHPRLPASHPLARHVLYRLRATDPAARSTLERRRGEGTGSASPAAAPRRAW
jgi:RimJ/RimL family protein N-acetyltransferase